MTTTTQASDISRFCSVCARQAGLDAAGNAYGYNHLLAVEIPLPWPESMYEKPGVLPQELLDLRKLLIEAYHRGESIRVSAYAIAPDTVYSQPGYRRILSYRCPEGAASAYRQEEYLVPEDQCGPAAWALLIDHKNLDRFEQYRLPATGARDLMVCTHGAIDAACAKFGFPIYRQLRQLADQSEGKLRAWRVSHFGGHVFAPTLLDMPEFRYWGYIEREEAELLATRRGDIARLRHCYRGWAGFESNLLQVAERELMMRYGWPWLDFKIEGRVLAQDEAAAPGDHDAQPAWAEVQINYTAPDGSEHGSYTARVELNGHVESIYSTNHPETYNYPQYIVTQLERLVD